MTIIKQNENFNWVYMLRCSRKTIYTGYTTDILKRYKEHLEGVSGAKFVKACKEIEIIGCWKIYGEKGDAMSLETFLKKLNKTQKEHFVKNPGLLNRFYKKNGDRVLSIKKENLAKIIKLINKHDLKEIRKIGRTPFKP